VDQFQSGEWISFKAAGSPVTGWLLKKRGAAVPGYVQFVVALLIMVAGRVAVVVVLHRPFLPQRSG
jgi:hypothetical protein